MLRYASSGLSRSAARGRARFAFRCRAWLATVAALLFASATAFAQDWRLEVGGGVQPLHMGFWHMSPSEKVEKQLFDKGQSIDTGTGFYPSVTVSGVWHYKECWELVLTGDVCWSHHQIMQYEQFGTDPAGKPRYDMRKRTAAGMIDSSPVYSATLHWRYLWIPEGIVNLYSGIGFGLIAGPNVFVSPSVTLLGLRVGGRHLYGFVEAPIGPYATFAAGGLGWTL